MPAILPFVNHLVTEKIAKLSVHSLGTTVEKLFLTELGEKGFVKYSKKKSADLIEASLRGGTQKFHYAKIHNGKNGETIFVPLVNEHGIPHKAEHNKAIFELLNREIPEGMIISFSSKTGHPSMKSLLDKLEAGGILKLQENLGGECIYRAADNVNPRMLTCDMFLPTK
jgi:hypothetical protein